jgi:hypothetical protein
MKIAAQSSSSLPSIKFGFNHNAASGNVQTASKPQQRRNFGLSTADLCNR